MAMRPRPWLGMVAALGSSAVLAVVFGVQAAIYDTTGSIALLSDAVHNLSDALTAIPVVIVLITRSAAWEALTILLIALVVLSSAVYAGYEAVRRIADPKDPRGLVTLAAGGVIGVVGNGIAAMIRAHVGRRIKSEALVADAHHAWADTVTSAAVLLSAGAAWVGWPGLDPVIGMAGAAWMVTIAVHIWIRKPTHGTEGA